MWQRHFVSIPRDFLPDRAGYSGPAVLVCGFTGSVYYGVDVRYVNVWLPVANIFSKILGTIQEKMLLIDITRSGRRRYFLARPI
ncbi:hypothetical protein CS542_08960 [Pedobacter sp. IW39]|nr:hypothetical protein CS542_08960 [Pedobacter sp. IW39]